MKRVYGTRQIEEAIRPYLYKKGWALFDCRINHFDEYQTQYGSEAAEEVTRMLEQLISRLIAELGTSEDVIGSESADHFVLITSDIASPKIKQLLKAKFNAEVLAYYSNADKERGYMVSEDDNRIPFMYLSIGVVFSNEVLGRSS